jgi:hypothetical protein
VHQNSGHCPHDMLRLKASKRNTEQVPRFVGNDHDA